MARFADGAHAEDLGLLHPGDDEFLQELLGNETPALDGVATLVSRSREPPSPSPLPRCPPSSAPATPCCSHVSRGPRVSADATPDT